MGPLAWIVQQILDLHRQFHLELSAGLQRAAEQGTVPWPLVGFAFGLGMVHALTPGHGKAILFTYFLGRRARPWAGIAAAAQIAATHIGTALLLVLGFSGAAFVLGRPTGGAMMLQLASAMAIAAAGCWYLWRSRRPPVEPAGGHSHTGIALAAGLLPCPLTMMILSVALGRASLGMGLGLVAAMGVGIMATIGMVGTAAIVIQRGIATGIGERVSRQQAILRRLETASSLVILGLGLYSIAVTLTNWP